MKCKLWTYFYSKSIYQESATSKWRDLIKVYIKKISTLVLTQSDRLHAVDQLLLKLSCDQDFPSDCFEFRGMWNIIGKRVDQNK